MSLAFPGALPWNGCMSIFRGALINPMVRLITPSLDEMQYVAVGVAQRYLLLKTSESRF